MADYPFAFFPCPKEQVCMRSFDLILGMVGTLLLTLLRPIADRIFSKHLITCVQNLEDYVGRTLVCNLIRELLFHGAKSSLFWSPESQPQIAMSFPVAQHSSSKWLANLRRFFSDIDSSIAFNDGYVDTIFGLAC